MPSFLLSQSLEIIWQLSYQWHQWLSTVLIPLNAPFHWICQYHAPKPRILGPGTCNFGLWKKIDWLMRPENVGGEISCIKICGGSEMWTNHIHISFIYLDIDGSLKLPDPFCWFGVVVSFLDDGWMMFDFRSCVSWLHRCFCWVCDLQDNLSERPHHPHWNFRENKTSCPDIRIFKSTNYFMGTDLVHMLRPSYDFIHLPLSKTRTLKHQHTRVMAFACTLYHCLILPNYILYTYIIYQINIHNNHRHDTSERPAPSTICRPSGLLGAPTHLRPAAPENQNQRQLRVTFLGSKCFLKLLILPS